MSLLSALLLVVGLVAVAAVAGVVATRRSARARRVESGTLDISGLGIELGQSATLVLFTTEFCARCPGVKRMLHSVADAWNDLAFAEVDLTHRSDVASGLHILQTPTTFILDGTGEVRARFGGVVAREAVVHELDRITGASHVLF
jgi:thiol-disulfide isomerase/thioredoxin